MHVDTLRQRLQRLPLHKVATILEDNRTQVFCENTAVAFTQLYLADKASNESTGREELTKLVRWPLVTATYFTHCNVDKSVLRALSCLTAVSAAQQVPAARIADNVKEEIQWANLTKPARPASFLASMTFSWEISMAELCHSFPQLTSDADSELVRSPSFYFGGLVWYLGRQWQLSCPESGHPKSWTFGAYLYAIPFKLFSKTTAAAERVLPELVGAKFAVTYWRDGKVVADSFRQGDLWRLSHGIGYPDIFGQSLEQWPAAGLPGVVDATHPLVLKSIIKEVL